MPYLLLSGVQTTTRIDVSQQNTRHPIRQHLCIIILSDNYSILNGGDMFLPRLPVASIHLLDRPDHELGRMATANGCTVHSGVNCEDDQKQLRWPKPESLGGVALQQIQPARRRQRPSRLLSVRVRF